MPDDRAIETARFEQILRQLEYLRQPQNGAARAAAVEQMLADDPELRSRVIEFLTDVSAFDGEEHITIKRLRDTRKALHESMERRVTREILGTPLSLADFPSRWRSTP